MREKPTEQNKNTVTIIAMWFAVAIIDFGLAIASFADSSSLGWPMIIPILIALFGTIYILSVQPWIDARLEQTGRDQEKAKREVGDMMAVLMELMDEDERAAFKQRLEERVLGDAGFTDDGEIPDSRVSLDALMEEDRDSLRR